MHTMQRRLVPSLPWLAVPALLALVCLVGCTPPLTFGQTPPQPTAPSAGEFSRLDVLRTSTFPQNHIPPFAATVTDATKIDQLYVAIEALPVYPTGAMHCPADLGVYDHLTFHYTTLPVLQVDIDTGGCQGVSFGGPRNRPEKWTAFSTQFWQLFAQILGVPVSTVEFILPQPQYTGPSAPTPSA